MVSIWDFSKINKESFQEIKDHSNLFITSFRFNRRYEGRDNSGSFTCSFTRANTIQISNILVKNKLLKKEKSKKWF